VGFDWSSSNPSVGEISNSGWATAIDSGYALMTGYFEEVIWENNGSQCLTQSNMTTGYSEMEVPPCPYPTNFRQVGQGTDVGNGVLHFEYTWDSSNENRSDLNNCTVGEIVTYSGNNPFIFPSPPFPSVAVPNPTINDHLATEPGIEDNHGSGGSFVTPYTSSSFTATQYYRYKCPCRNGGQYVNLTGPISIIRTVSPSAGTRWKYTITKSGATATINPLP
jgi:hypothetical protein